MVATSRVLPKFRAFEDAERYAAAGCSCREVGTEPASHTHVGQIRYIQFDVHDSAVIQMPCPKCRLDVVLSLAS